MAFFAPLVIGRQGLVAHERALRVAGHNIANVSTPGYSRQRAEITAGHTDPSGYGTGSVVRGVSQSVDALLELRRLASTSTLSGATSGRDLLDRLQGLVPVGDTGLADALQRFFASANALATSPQDIAVRTELLSRGEQLAAQLRTTAGGVAILQREIDTRIDAAARDANGVLQTIALLNREIVAAGRGGLAGNDQRDARREALGQLAAALEVRVVEQEDGSVNVFAASGRALVLGPDAATLATEPDTSVVGLDGSALSKVGLRGGGGVVALSGDVGGAIGALLALRDETLPEVATQLDQLALTLRDAVNGIQTDPAGRDLDGLVGAAFFTGAGAADLTVSLADPRGIAAAQGGDPSDNTNALALAGLASASLAPLGGATFDEFFGALQSRVGEHARDADETATIEEMAAEALAAQRDAISGVSLEEEFVDLIRFQRGFQASAQLISVSNRLLDDLLGLVD